MFNFLGGVNWASTMWTAAAERFWKWVGQSWQKSMISGDKQNKNKRK